MAVSGSYHGPKGTKSGVDCSRDEFAIDFCGEVEWAVEQAIPEVSVRFVLGVRLTARCGNFRPRRSLPQSTSPLHPQCHRLHQPQNSLTTPPTTTTTTSYFTVVSAIAVFLPESRPLRIHSPSG